MGRFADASAKTRYDLADGEDWVEFRSELSYAESQQVESGAFVGKLDQETQEMDVGVDWAAYGVNRLSGWIADWSFTGDDGKKVSTTRTWIGRLSDATAQELGELLDKHIEALDGDEGKDGSGEAS